MVRSKRGAYRAALSLTCAVGALTVVSAAHADPAPAAGDATAVSDVVVTMARTTRSSVVLAGSEMQKILPGVSPLKAIQTLPGVVYLTADPWGNNEQNESLFVHGFNTQQLGYTMDGVPLGDQQYGNYNGLSVSRAVTSENVGRVNLESGAGSLGVASTSNLGGAIETYSVDPKKTYGATIAETVGSYDTTRTFVRLETGQVLGGEAYVSYLHQSQKAWDFDGYQNGDQVNLKYVHDDSHGKLTIFGDWSDKVEPNEDADGVGNQAGGAGSYLPYTRPFLYPNLAAAIADVAPSAANGNKPGTPPTAEGNNFSNYFSAAQRTDVLTYAKYDYDISPNITWSNQVYYHYNYGRGIVAGPINQASLPVLFAGYYPGQVVGGSATSVGTLNNIVADFGGTGYAVRTTEYRINREGELSTLNWQLGQHAIEAGFWFEHDESAQHRVWYPMSPANDDMTPYEVPDGPKAFTQYYNEFYVNDVQLHLQDQWRILPDLLIQAGFKSSLQTASNKLPIQQVNGPLTPASSVANYPVGTLTSNNGFLPQVGVVWDAPAHSQVFANVQENMRQYIPYGAGSNFYGASPWSVGSQQAFNLFKQTGHPETSWTYELGARTQQSLDFGVITGFEGQASVYHVNFYNRILNVAAYSFLNPQPAILVNVGGVTTNGVDVAGTLHFGSHVQLYDAVSYNKSTYNDDYLTGTTIVSTHGKWVPLTPDWLNKTILSFSYGSFEAQVNGDYIGRRYATYLNDEAVPSTFQVGAEASYLFHVPDGAYIKTFKLSANVTNIGDIRGASTVNVTGASGGYTYYPIAPTMGFVTLNATF
jgi:iron complex outermembrane receptor protein